MQKGWKFTESYDRSLDAMVCASLVVANEGDYIYMPQTGVSTRRCIGDWRGDGRCDAPNNHGNVNCGYDGGDCCRSTCVDNCANAATRYDRDTPNCEYVCGEMSSYFCLDPQSVNSTNQYWCSFGKVVQPSECYYSYLDIAKALQECIMDDASHGNEINSAAQCGNKTLTCTEIDVQLQNGCHLRREQCWEKPCCTKAIKQGFIQANPAKLPTLAELWNHCLSQSRGNVEEPCFKSMVKCVQDNHHLHGGCCMCDPGFTGWKCTVPVCWPKCVHGKCIAPDVCYCESGWKGQDCAHPVCDPECIPGQGVCVLPNRCQCFYGWRGDRCETPMSVPDCVNGHPIAPDVCRCAPGWGGRICDYPLCQTWPKPTASCGNGACVKPFTCECDPGWERDRPINATGYDIKPFWSHGQDVTLETAGTYIMGDSRIGFLSYWDRIYNASNAPLCTIMDCSQIHDPRCTECNPSTCLKCEPLFFANLTTGRCERCSNVFPHCQLCGPLKRGNLAQIAQVRCLVCDPHFVLYFDHCVSDGPIEFGSPVYHVKKNVVHLMLDLYRNPYIMGPTRWEPVTVMVRTRDGTAHSRSLEYGETLANFEFKVYYVHFDVDPDAPLPVGGAGNSTYDEALPKRFRAKKVLNISIYDDVSFFRGMRYFDVELFLTPEHLVGHQGPLWPFLAPKDYEPEHHWLAPKSFGRSPLLERQDVLATARVYVWDMEEATAANSTCSGACSHPDWKVPTVIFIKRRVTVTARKHDGTLSRAPRDKFITVNRPLGEGKSNCLGTPNWMTRGLDPSEHSCEYEPLTPGPYKLIVEKVIPGVLSDYWWNRAVRYGRPQLPDTSRVDHVLDFNWTDISEAPSFARWRFHVHFECIRSEKWPYAFGHAVGISVPPGSTIKMWFWNDGLLVNHYIPPYAKQVDIREIDHQACFPTAEGKQPYLTFSCVDLLFHEPIVDPLGIYTFMVEWTAPEPTLEKTPISIHLAMYHQDHGNRWGWWRINQECLFTHGLNIQGSPFEDLLALPGLVDPTKSTVTDVHGGPGPLGVLVEHETEARMILRDENFNVIRNGAVMLAGMTIEVRTETNVVDGAVKATWVPERGEFELFWIANKPAVGAEDLSDGEYRRYLHVKVGLIPIVNSPITIRVFMGLSDPNQTRIIAGRYTPAKASEHMWFRLQSATSSGMLRVTGGDKYTVVFDGPSHANRSENTSYRGTVKDNRNGTYDVTFEIMRPGLYSMYIALFKAPIRHSPFTDVAVWDDLSAELTTANGPGVDAPAGMPPGTPAQIRAGELTYFQVIVTDTYGMQYPSGGADLELRIGSFNNESDDMVIPQDVISLEDFDNGSYIFRYRVCAAGSTHAEVLLYTVPNEMNSSEVATWRHIHGSPFRIDVLPLAAHPTTSFLQQPPLAPHSGILAHTLVGWRDHCRNAPPLEPERFAQPVGVEVNFSRLGPPFPSGPDVDVDVLRASPGESTIFFTPGRRGIHNLSVTIDGEHIVNSPMSIDITPSGILPSGDDPQWILGAVGASALSTFSLVNSPARAASPLVVNITSVDIWGDPLELGNDTFLIGLWRQGGPCAPPVRCAAFSETQKVCDRVGSCYFDVLDSICRPKCDPAQPGLNYSLMDPDVSVVLDSVIGSSYMFKVTTPTSGVYHGQVSTLRLGGLQAHFFDTKVMSRRLHVEFQKGPFDFGYDLLSPALPVAPAKYVVRWIGWLRMPHQDNYTLYLASDGMCVLWINGTVLINTTAGRDHENIAAVDIMLHPGFVPLQLDYYHTHQNRFVGAYVRLSYGSHSSPIRVIPASFLYYEEGLQQSAHGVRHVVQPLERATGIAIEGEAERGMLPGGLEVFRACFARHEHLATAQGQVRGLNITQCRRGTAGQPFTIRLHSIDAYGNVLLRRDPRVSLHLSSYPQFTAAGWQGYVLAAARWRILPLANGSWDVVLRPDAGDVIYNLTFQLRGLESGGVLFTRHMQVEVVSNEAHPKTSWVVCVPVPPQPAGTAVTCTVLPRDLEGNDLADTEVQMELLNPHGATETVEVLNSGLTMPLPLKDTLHLKDTFGRTFRFYPTVKGLWTVKATVLYDKKYFVEISPIIYEVIPGPVSTLDSGSLVEFPDMILTLEPTFFNISSRDAYGNVVDTENEVWQVQMRGDFKNSRYVEGSVKNVAPGVSSVELPRIDQRTSYIMRIDHLSWRTNGSLALCPELKPVYGRVVRLSRYRAVGSLALTECLPGYTRLSGEEMLRCEARNNHAESHGAEWRSLVSLEVSILVCRPATFWCPPLNLVNSELVSWNWRRELRSTATIRCVEGHQMMLGNPNLVCGTRDGIGVWLTADGDRAITVECSPKQHLCPALDPINAEVVNMSADRDISSIARFQCNSGYEYLSGNEILACTADDVDKFTWKQPVQVLPGLAPTEFKCELSSDFCSDPAEMLHVGVRIGPGGYSRLLGGTVSFECVEGYKRLLGETDAKCVVSRSNDSMGQWVNTEAEYFSQVDFYPLRCILIQDWCPTVFVPDGILVSMSNEYYYMSKAVFACAPGFEQTGGSAELLCDYNADRSAGAWLPRSATGVDRLQCSKIERYCPEPEPMPSVTLYTSDGLKLNSTLDMSCSLGYQPATIRPGNLAPPPSLQCRPGPGGVGRWVTKDGLPIAVSTMACNGIIAWCPELDVRGVIFQNLTGARRPTSTVVMGCNMGFDLHAGSQRLPNHTVATCTNGTADGGAWMLTDFGVPLSAVWCKATPMFCPNHIPAYTTVFGVDKVMNVEEDTYSYNFSDPNLTFGSIARLTCNNTAEYLYSFGDTEVTCGYNHDKTGGAWRSPRGMLAVDFHCYYIGVPRTVRDTAYRTDDCFSSEDANVSIPVFFERTGSIIFWMKPSAWDPGDTIITSDNPDDIWRVTFAAPGVINAQVAKGVGHVRIDITQNGIKGLNDWYHIAFVWTLGVGLAGLGEVFLWVDGILAGPADPAFGYAVPPDGVTGSQRLDHFTWHPPGESLVLGGYYQRTVPGMFNYVRVFTRALPLSHVNDLRRNEDPRCGFHHLTCNVPGFVRAYIELVHNPYAKLFRLMRQRPETRLRLKCDPGFVQTEGDNEIECRAGGAWTAVGTNRVAERMRCCEPEEDWCPPLDLSYPGAILQSSGARARYDCTKIEGGGGAGMGVRYKLCPEIVVANGFVVYTDGLNFNSDASLSCSVGYTPISDFEMHINVKCYRGVYDSSVHLDSVVDGEWKTSRMTQPNFLQCEGIQNWCPELDIEQTRVIESTGTGTRRTGDTKKIECLPGLGGTFSLGEINGTFEHMVFECRKDRTWAAVGEGDLPPNAIECIPYIEFCPTTARAITGFQGHLLDMHHGTYSVTFANQRILETAAMLACGENYVYSFGDSELFCNRAFNGTHEISAWQRAGGGPEVPLHCRDLLPQVRGATWHSDLCRLVGGSNIGHSVKVPYRFRDEGTIALWVRLPSFTDYAVLWSSFNETCVDDPIPPSTFTATTTTFDPNATNMSNETFDSVLVNDSNDSTGTASRRLMSADLELDPNESRNLTYNLTPVDVLGEVLRCHGPQHMIVDQGSLQVQLGDGIGRYAVDLPEIDVDEFSWVHLVYRWSSSGAHADLFVNGLPLHTNYSDNVPGKKLNSSFEFYLGLPHPLPMFKSWDPTALHEQTATRIFNDARSDEDVERLHRFNMPYCSGVTCPPLPRDGYGLVRAHVVQATSADAWIPPDTRRTGTYLHLTCNLGYAPSAGVSVIWCDKTGQWAYPIPEEELVNASDVSEENSGPSATFQDSTSSLLGPNGTRYFNGTSWSDNGTISDSTQGAVPGFSFHGFNFVDDGSYMAGSNETNETTLDLDSNLSVALARPWLECCDFQPDFCPDVDAPKLVNSAKFVNATRVAAACGPLAGKLLRSSTRLFRHLGARARFGCPLGYMQVDGHREHVCAMGIDTRRPLEGRWIDVVTGAEAVLPVCELIDLWCPLVQGESSYIVSASLGRRFGSVLTSQCLDGFNVVGGNETLFCDVNAQRDGGRWVDADGADNLPLKCARQGVATTTPAALLQKQGDDVLRLDQRFGANASLRCLNNYRQVHGDDPVFCVLGPSPTRPDGTRGRWVDKHGDNAETPVCELRSDWCPEVPTEGKHSLLASTTDGYRWSSVATMRCLVGYERLAGNYTFECVNNANATGGIWTAPPLVCRLARYFCPRLVPVNATTLTFGTPMDYKLGDYVSFRCKRGFKYLFGDNQAWCSISDTLTNRGQWKREDGSPAIGLVCAPIQEYCPMPNVSHGIINHITLGSRLGGAVEFRCRHGYFDTRDPRSSIRTRTALCLHRNDTLDDEGGKFYAGMSYETRDTLRAISMVKQILDMLEEHSTLEPPLEVDPLGVDMSFEQRWREELGDELESLRNPRHVEAVLDELPDFYRNGTSYDFSYLTLDHVRILHRLLVAKVEELHDATEEEARALFGAYDRIKINFQDPGTPTPFGWLRDIGHVFGDRGNGFSYGWTCDISDGTINSGTHNRMRSVYTSLENTLIETDTRSRCPGQMWRIRLPTGRYRVEVTVQDTQYVSPAGGCELQGENLNFPKIVQPAGSRETRNLTVDVVDFLTMSADRDRACSSVNRITIQNVDDADARLVDQPLLSCTKIPEWCPPPVPPPNSHISSPGIRPEEMHELGDEVRFECDSSYVHKLGISDFFCGTEASDQTGQWRKMDGSQTFLDMVCIKNRSWCPALPELGLAAVLMSLKPPTHEVGSRATFGCLRGYRPASDWAELDPTMQCFLGNTGVQGEWLIRSSSGSWEAPPHTLSCELIPDYCPPLRSASGELVVAAGHLIADEPWPYETIIQNTTLPVPNGSVGATTQSNCPKNYQRVHGTVDVVCSHGTKGMGVWQPADNVLTHLLDAVVAEPVVCELEPLYGLRRHYFTTTMARHDRIGSNGFDAVPDLGSFEPLYGVRRHHFTTPMARHGMHGGIGSNGFDVVPNLDQNTSLYDAAHFEGYFKPPHSGTFVLIVEVIGRFLLSLSGRVLLTGRSKEAEIGHFKAGGVMLSSSEYYPVSLQYTMDPVIPYEKEISPIPRYVRLLFTSPPKIRLPLVVPSTALRHSFAPASGFPRVVALINDPFSCVSGQIQEIKNLGYQDRGFIFDGSERDYNQDLRCRWILRAGGLVRFNFYVNFFDVQYTPGCVADRLTFSQGSLDNLEVVTNVCGTYSAGNAVASVKNSVVIIDFYTDGELELQGWNLTYVIEEATSDDPPSLFFGPLQERRTA